MTSFAVLVFSFSCSLTKITLLTIDLLTLFSCVAAVQSGSFQVGSDRYVIESTSSSSSPVTSRRRRRSTQSSTSHVVIRQDPNQTFVGYEPSGTLITAEYCFACPGRFCAHLKVSWLRATRHGSITFMSVTIKLQLHLILPIPITITITFSCL